MKTKICTDQKQSDRLIEMGIDPKTADMYRWLYGRDWLVSPLENGRYNSATDKLCWSLSALLRIIKRFSLHTTFDGKIFIVPETSVKPSCFSEDYDNEVDACVDLIVKLHSKQ